jgi:hypothetical protein
MHNRAQDKRFALNIPNFKVITNHNGDKKLISKFKNHVIPLPIAIGTAFRLLTSDLVLRTSDLVLQTSATSPLQILSSI